MKRLARLSIFVFCVFALQEVAAAVDAPATQPAAIRPIDPPEKEFFTKALDYDGIVIKAPAVVADEALFEARRRIASMLDKQPQVRANLRKAGAELHIIGKDQGTSDLPEFRHLKGKPFDGNLTIDERARGMGGRQASCGEENLLKLPNDRYRGRDICRHEFGHGVFQVGVDSDFRQKVTEQRQRSLDKGLWVNSYAGSNPHEFFSEMTMWYFGTHGDMNMKGPKPANGPEGLKAYDPETYKLFDDFYQGRIKIAESQWTPRRGRGPATRPAGE